MKVLHILLAIVGSSSTPWAQSQAQMLAMPGSVTQKFEIPIARSAASVDAMNVLSGKLLKQAEREEMSAAMKILKDSCASCMIIVKNDPPKITSGGGGEEPVVTLWGNPGNETVSKAEDCPSSKPFFDESKKRCYALFLLQAADDANKK